MTTSGDAQAAFAATLVDEWVRGGVTDAVAAPGSRSTPLLIALDSDPRVRLHMMLDERAAGFVALGLGMASGRPAPVVTTSGTAAVELHPAVVEAHQAGVPLIAVTADRPAELHHVGAPQTIEQAGLFHGAVRWEVSADLTAGGSWRPIASRTVAVARGASAGAGPGPVHLNVAFREPLLVDPALGGIPPGRPGGQPWHHVPALRPPAPPPEVLELLSQPGGRGLILAGAGAGDPEAVIAVAAALGWPLLADPLSGCRLPRRGVVAAADALVRTPVFASWQPEVVLRLGRPWASKALAAWLARADGRRADVLIDPFGRWADPDARVSHVVGCDPALLCTQLRGRITSASGDGSWLEGWCTAEDAAQRAIDETLASVPGVSEPGIARRVMASVHPGATVVASSSMPVRDLEWFAAPREDVRVVSNRGANGIDGVVSTTLGVALAGGSTLALLGDLAFVYDAGALLWARTRGIDCTLVVVDNDGGGIFSFLPQAGEARERFERLWGTPHGLDLARLAESYGVPSACAVDLESLEEEVRSGKGGVRVVIARTDRLANVALHERINAAVASAIERAL